MKAQNRLEAKLEKYMLAFEYAEAQRDYENARKYIEVVLRLQDALLEIEEAHQNH